MEVSITKIAGREVYVLFVGSHYYFYSNYYGLIGIAERAGYDGDDARTFKITAGNNDTYGGAVNKCSIITAMKHFISKNENKNVAKDIIYLLDEGKCNHGIKVEAWEYKL